MTKRVRRGMAVIAAMLLIMLDISFAYAAPEADDKEPDMDAGGAVLMEKDTGIVLLSKNAHQKLPMASTTKIMTALVVIENCSLGETVEVVSKAYGVEGSSMYLKAGEKISVEDLLYGLMLLSGNDAAVALAIHTAGTVEAFAALMNKRAESIGARNTHFVTPNGLHDAEHYTTAYDLALIAAEAMKNEAFRTIVASTYHKSSTGSLVRYMKNKNKILWEYEGGCGVKTGYTKAAGKCLVFAAERNGMSLIGVVLRCQTMFPTAKAMLDYGFGLYSVQKVISAGDVIVRTRVLKGTKTSLAAAAKDDIMIPVKKGERACIKTEIMLDEGLSAPVELGQEIGTLKVFVNDKLAAQTSIVACESIAPLEYGHYLNKLLGMWAA